MTDKHNGTGHRMKWADPDGSDLSDAEYQELFKRVNKEVMRPLEEGEGDMTPKEAIESAGDNWFRPVIWQGAGIALCVKGEHVHIVPSSHGGVAWWPRQREICCDWEIVDIDTVLEER